MFIVKKISSNLSEWQKFNVSEILLNAWFASACLRSLADLEIKLISYIFIKLLPLTNSKSCRNYLCDVNREKPYRVSTGQSSEVITYGENLFLPPKKMKKAEFLRDGTYQANQNEKNARQLPGIFFALYQA
jgi:hypothetical protein